MLGAVAVQHGNTGLIIIITSVVTAWMLTIFAAVPLYRDWKRRHGQVLSDQGLMRDEVLGRAAHDGMPSKPALSVMLNELLRKVEELNATSQRQTHANTEVARQLSGVGKTVTAQQAEIAKVRDMITNHLLEHSNGSQ